MVKSLYEVEGIGDIYFGKDKGKGIFFKYLTIISKNNRIALFILCRQIKNKKQFSGCTFNENWLCPHKTIGSIHTKTGEVSLKMGP
jgi:hypothetical protein